MRALAFALCASVLGGALSAQTTWYVDDTGDDNNTGLSPSDAKKTIQTTIFAASSGDTINVLPGTYMENLYIDIDLRLEGRPGAVLDAGNGTGILIESAIQPITSFTQVKNLYIRGQGVGEGVYLSGGYPNDARIENNEIVNFGVGISVEPYLQSVFTEHRPLIRYNTIRQTLHAQPQGIGIRARPMNGSNLFWIRPTVQANRISFMWRGIECSGTKVSALLRSDSIFNCTWGILIDGGFARVSHETVAHDPAFPNFATVRGIEVGPGAIHLTNSLIWVPDGTDPLAPFCGIDLLGLPSAFQIVNTISEDCGMTPCSFTTYPTICVANPLFVDLPNGDLRLQPGSPAVDLGDAALVSPGGVDPVDHDVFGNPRLIDPARSGVLLPDCGAHELSPVDLDLVIPGGGSGQAMVDAQLGTTLQFTLTGLPNDAGFFWLAPDSYEMNAIVSPLGNMLVYPLTIFPVTMTNDPSGQFSTGTVSIFLPLLATAQIETEQSYQASLIGAGYPTVYVGNLTRRIEVEINAP